MYNLITGNPVWSLEEGGTITPNGLLDAGETIGTFISVLIAELDGFQATADLQVIPSAVNRF